MIFLTGDTRSHELVARLRLNGWGRIWVDQKPTPYEGEPWGIDSGAFRDWSMGGTTDWGLYAERCHRAAEIGGCYLAVLPDLVARGEWSLDFSLEAPEMFGLPRDLPWYLAVQDGMVRGERALADNDWIKGVFLGGTLRYKGSAPWWAGAAKEAGKLAHYGRCGVPKRVSFAKRLGYDSCDSAFPLWNKKRIGEIELALKGELPQMEMQL
jgi:hypothetical protein|tara:strand:- start:24 stop:653 length:630 start_codon:yes stop_codon:yes gene_type:complete